MITYNLINPKLHFLKTKFPRKHLLSNIENMKSCIVLLLLFITLTVHGEKKVVCYWASWSFYRTGAGAHKVSNINPAHCTHYVYTFTGLDIDGKITSLDTNLDLTNQGFKTFIDLKNRPGGANAKIILAIGGWNEGSLKYSVVSFSICFWIR